MRSQTRDPFKIEFWTGKSFACFAKFKRILWLSVWGEVRNKLEHLSIARNRGSDGMCQSDLCLYKLFLISNGRLLPFLLSAPLCKKNCSKNEIRKRMFARFKNDSNGLGPNKKRNQMSITQHMMKKAIVVI